MLNSVGVVPKRLAHLTQERKVLQSRSGQSQSCTDAGPARRLNSRQ
jgi:hypothetical protein